MTAPQMIAMDKALAEVEIPPPDAGNWAGQLAEVARRMRAVIRRHRDVVPSSVGFLPCGAHALSCHERVLAIMRNGGLPGRRAVAGLHLLWLIVNGFSLEETHAGQSAGAGPDLSPEVSRYFAALPGDRFPNLNAVAGELAETSFDERFELLIGIFIDGLAARAGRS